MFTDRNYSYLGYPEIFIIQNVFRMSVNDVDPYIGEEIQKIIAPPSQEKKDRCKSFIIFQI